MNPIPLNLILLFLYFTPALSLDPKFEACEPKTCGAGPNISYPFYIRGRQNPFCGNPGFEVTCGHNGLPILNLINSNYTVERIFYRNHTLRVTNPAFSRGNGSSACLGHAQNVTVGRYRFRVAPGQREVWVAYGCQGVGARRIGCDAGNGTASVWGVEVEAEVARGKCSGGVVAATVEDVRGGVAEALRRGFLLIWNATNCTECMNSGGRCGFDPDPDTYAFRCYCPDRPHAVKCGTRYSPSSAFPTFISFIKNHINLNYKILN
uniref:non-specific serine/threonine protein kinase n=1 Tax=Cajanus cajan TaxID=3821 RepID=A0A151SN73_CAJCA|nr:putative serine/threonine-protein kinase At1g18390 family [Cajanus cajan]